jgi:hypothetical protein
MKAISLCRHDEKTQRIRKDLADLYRDIRKDNPAMARLLHRRMADAANALSGWLYRDGL